MIEVYEPGTKVMLDEAVSATIVTVAIHAGNYVQYECAWWGGGSRTREWFHKDEILEVIDEAKTKTQIGFASGGT